MAINWPWNHRVISMRRILIDACGWAAVIEAGINIDRALIECTGTRELATVPNVITELEALNDRRLMLPMLIAKVEMVTPPIEAGKHTDTQLLALAKENNWPILTVDTELKRRLSLANIPWIEVSGRSHLRQIG